MNSSTVIAGALLSQVSMVSILSIGAALLRGASTRTAWWKGQRVYHALWLELLALLLVSVGCLVFTSTMSAIWSPLFSGTSFSGLSDDTAMVVVFSANIFVVTRLVFATGGSVDSPFQPLFFFIPTIALLLREPSERVVSYSVIVSFCFIALLYRSHPAPSENPSRVKQACGFVAIACLFLAVLIGLLTRK